MADQTEFNSYSGKLGNTVGIYRKGSSFVRTAPESVNVAMNSLKSSLKKDGIAFNSYIFQSNFSKLNSGSPEQAVFIFRYISLISIKWF